MTLKMTVPPSRPRIWIEYAVALVIVLFGAALVALAFEQLPIEGTPLALDWRSLWPNLRDGHITYVGGGLMIAPWSLPVVVPLGFFSVRSSWGLLTLGTVAVLIASVPRMSSKRSHWLSVLLLVISWPALRHAADGNFEGLVIAGVLLILGGYRRQSPVILVLGLLLATTKPQEIWLFIPVVGLFVLMSWPMKKWLQAGVLTLIVVIPALLWFGRAWISAMSGIQPPPRTIIDITLGAALQRIGMPECVLWIVGLIMLMITARILMTGPKTLKREKAAMLICASLLLAPYAAGNTFLTVLAIGIIPVFQAHRLIGSILIFLSDLQFFLPRDFLYNYGAYYWTLMLLIVWGTLGYLVYGQQSTGIIETA